ncbi:DNA-binding transcriptional LysR family regulator [Actinoplanes lutulentus]|uniref:DNA-binding transcriptional LysR family regulator n=1 Tax=Actinoplanes lutulentus TaxID=1287878 RepID=A0A327Z7R3_9ACTN|nr:LysR family transcriptional regulator [Actinoplanes lutulentus]MBB2948560.1 DNA-binding transcriptional LysR family regulator [Actinoplanes lutulentus]RAK34408.1 DNA-binding transcriptional LysR family regulator [Actinoplanes lutulentus]
MLDLHRLRIFRSVVASGSVHAAATNLGYTPSAVSQHVAALQRETGLALLERAGRGVRPTSAGLALAAEADELLARLGAAEDLVAGLRSGRAGTLSIAYFASAGVMWLPAVVSRLSSEFPGLRLDLRLNDEAPDHPDERADVHLVVARGPLTVGPGSVSHHLRDDPYVAVVPRGHPVADLAQVTLVELERERWIDNDSARGWCRRILLDACAAVGFRPVFHVEAHDYRAALAFVAAGVGITVLPALTAEQPPDGVVVVPVARPAPVRSIHAIVRESAAGTKAGQMAVELLRASSKS